MAFQVGVISLQALPLTPTRCVQRFRLAAERAAPLVMASLNRGRISLPPLCIEGQPSMQGEAKRVATGQLWGEPHGSVGLP
jgi:hypothetical protein